MARSIGMKSPKRTKSKVLAVLSEEDRLEYARRNSLVIQKKQELDACALFLEFWQDMMIQKYGLPGKFDIDLNTGRATLRPEGGNDAQNGRV